MYQRIVVSETLVPLVAADQQAAVVQLTSELMVDLAQHEADGLDALLLGPVEVVRDCARGLGALLDPLTTAPVDKIDLIMGALRGPKLALKQAILQGPLRSVKADARRK